MIIKSHEIKNYLNNKNNIYLFYGENIDLIEELINKNIKTLFPNNIYNYEESEILFDTDTFKINLFNKSFFEDEKLIIINRVSDKILNLIKDIIEKELSGTKIILKTDILDKRSKLRNFFEENDELIIMPFYQDNLKTLHFLTQNFFKENKINISTQSINYILEKSKGNRIALKNELEKIKNFSLNKLSIELDDLIKITNSAENYKVSELTDQCLAKNKIKIINILNDNNSSLEENILILRSLLLKLKRLKKLKDKMKVDGNYDRVISSYKPPIFWKDKDIVKKQLKNLAYKDIKISIQKISELELLIKKNPSLSNEITNNFIFETIERANNLI
jgi:DNA polymerase-3 subunit delta